MVLADKYEIGVSLGRACLFLLILSFKHVKPWQVFSAGRGGSGGTCLAMALVLNCIVLDFPLGSNAIDAGLKSDPKGKC